VENLLLAQSLAKIALEHENKSYWTAGQNSIPWNVSNRTSRLEALTHKVLGGTLFYPCSLLSSQIVSKSI
jgi:hypothetical protein